MAEEELVPKKNYPNGIMCFNGSNGEINLLFQPGFGLKAVSNLRKKDCNLDCGS